jgi:hypothetical protein
MANLAQQEPLLDLNGSTRYRQTRAQNPSQEKYYSPTYLNDLPSKNSPLKYQASNNNQNQNFYRPLPSPPQFLQATQNLLQTRQHDQSQCFQTQDQQLQQQTTPQSYVTSDPNASASFYIDNKMPTTSTQNNFNN